MDPHEQISKKVPWWSYKVKFGDDNYDFRTDNINDYMDFDSGQNWQIELHYKECCSGIKQFGDKYIIVGDMNCEKNGFKYHVWGTSANFATWREQNCTSEGAPSRQLRRAFVDKGYNEDDKAYLSEESSDENNDEKDKSDVYDPLTDIHFESTDKKAYDALVSAI